MAHAAVVERVLEVGGRAVRAGYVEGVATTPTRQGEGLGSLVMQRVGQLLEAEFEVGALSTGRHAFYERLGWERWRGPTFVRHGPDSCAPPTRTTGSWCCATAPRRVWTSRCRSPARPAPATTGNTSDGWRGSVPAWIAVVGADEVERLARDALGRAAPARRAGSASDTATRTGESPTPADRSYVLKVGPVASAAKWTFGPGGVRAGGGGRRSTPPPGAFRGARGSRRSHLRVDRRAITDRHRITTPTACSDVLREPRDRDRQAPLHRARRLQLTARQIGAVVPFVGRLHRLSVGADPAVGARSTRVLDTQTVNRASSAITELAGEVDDSAATDPLSPRSLRRQPRRRRAR